MKVVLKKKDEKYKLYGLAALGVVASYLGYSNLGGGGETKATPSQLQAAAPVAGSPAETSAIQRRGITARAGAEFRPSMKKRPEDRVDPNKIDPTLRLDLLAKVQSVSLEGGARNLFQFGAAAPPPSTPLAPIPKVGKVVVNGPPPPPAVIPPPGPPPAPSAPPIPLKYYGFTNTKGEPRKKAFFLDGEEIIVAWEGETVKSRYRIVHIGVNSIEMEDTQFKSKQTLPLEPEPVA